ncbi:putative sugar O-methyltransferase [Seohaeicola saemankumensis]|nr:putative sugar O-methyltransferase [Seohaeicola saemankumensis]MCA0870171.1 putative sugar O-methyltransferase [Seohaeicola saemankumensis]
MSYYLTKLLPGLKEYVASADLRSDSDNGSYLLSVRRAVASYRHFENFKRDKAYNKILEHVSREDGQIYLDVLKSRDDGILEAARPTLLQSDVIGNPRKYDYAGESLSPTTLRYLKVASDLKRLFGGQIGSKIAEIGGGYGGQALVCDDVFKTEEYHIFDLPDVTRLVSRYLESFLMHGSYVTHTLNAAQVDSYDLIISNYAFSEVPKAVQSAYVRKVLAQSKRGYLTMNSGKSDHAGREGAKLTLAELESMLPPFEIYDEHPVTAPHNYIIVWGHEPGATL